MTSLPQSDGGVKDVAEASAEAQTANHPQVGQMSNTDIEECPRFSGFRPLDTLIREIRLLFVNKNGLQLQHYSLNNPPRFHAISHCWGRPDVMRPVMINGEEVEIRQTTWFLLQSLIQNYSSLLVWLDMLCIDQRDMPERAYQVGLMGEIYSKATTVHAWLGAHSADSEIPIQFAFEFRSNPVQAIQEDSKLYHSWRNNVFGPAFSSIFVRPYWRRLWIVQELILAKEIFLVCGTDILDWESFVKAARFWDIYNWDLNNRFMSDGTRTFEKIIRDRNDPGSFEENLVKVLHTYVINECSNRRDKIYALQSLVPGLERLEVNYFKTVLDVFIDVLQLGLLNLSTGCQAATLLFVTMGLTMSDLRKSIEAKCQDTVPFKIFFVYKIEEINLPTTEIEAPAMIHTCVDLYERQSDEMSLLHRVKLRSETIKRACKGDYLCRSYHRDGDWVIVRRNKGLDAFTVIDFMSMNPFFGSDPERHISQIEATCEVRREGEGADAKVIQVDRESVVVLLRNHQGGFSILRGLKLV